MKKVSIVTVGSAVYLAAPLKFDDKGVVITAAMPLQGTDVTKNDLVNYIIHENSNTLEKDITVTGHNVTFSERDLSEDLMDEVAILEAKFKKAEKKALPNLVNQAFKQML